MLTNPSVEWLFSQGDLFAPLYSRLPRVNSGKHRLQKFRMLVPTMIGAAPALEKLGGRVPSCRFRALRPFHQYTLLA